MPKRYAEGTQGTQCAWLRVEAREGGSAASLPGAIRAAPGAEALRLPPPGLAAARPQRPRGAPEDPYYRLKPLFWALSYGASPEAARDSLAGPPA